MEYSVRNFRTFPVLLVEKKHLVWCYAFISKSQNDLNDKNFLRFLQYLSP